jgi:catechol 2,3-dioxygenase-like lactoylglutathione lyase family enzyme
VLAEIGGRSRNHERHFTADAHGNHVPRDALARPDSRVELPGNDIHDPPVNRNVDADFGIQREESSDHRGEDEVCGRRRNSQAEQAGGFGTKIVQRFKRCSIIVERRAEPLHQALPGRACSDRSRRALDQTHPDAGLKVRTNSLTLAGDTPSFRAAFLKLFSSSTATRAVVSEKPGTAIASSIVRKSKMVRSDHSILPRWPTSVYVHREANPRPWTRRYRGEVSASFVAGGSPNQTRWRNTMKQSIDQTPFVGVRHVGLLAKDPVSLANFYREVMGMKIVRQTPPDSPNGALAFVARHPEEEDHDIVFVSNAALAHTAFRVASLGDLLACYRKIKEQGVPIKYSLNHAIELAFYFEDPEGHVIEIYWVTGLRDVHEFYAEPIDLEVPEEQLRQEVDHLAARFGV